MRVQTKLISLLLILSVVFSVGRYYFQVFEDKRMVLLFKEDTKDKNTVFENFIKLKGNSLEILAYDYTYWDEMVNFVHKDDLSWAQKNIDENVLKTYQADAIWVYKLNLSLAYSIKSKSASSLNELPLPQEAISTLFLKSRFCHFFINTKAGLMEIRGATIQPSADVERITPPRGYFFTGRLWNKTYIGELLKFTGGEVMISNIRQDVLPYKTLLKTKTILFSRELFGWEGKPEAYIYLKLESKELKNFEHFSHKAAMIFLSFLIAVLIFTMIFLTTLVSAPLSMISRALKTEKPVGSLKLQKDTSEFGDISRLISNFFKQKQELVREINERKKLEEALWESQERYRAIVENSSSLGISIVDTDYRIVMVNEAFAKLFKKTPADFIGKTCYESYENRQTVCDHCPGVRAMASGKASDEDIHIKLGDGTRLDVHVRAIPLFGRDGGLKGFIEIVEDITARIKAQERQKLLVEDLKDMNKIMVGRELKMIELKDEVNRLSRRLNIPEPYV